MSSPPTLLFVGDIVGPLGLLIAEQCLPAMREELGVDLVVANGENSADSGLGIEAGSMRRLLACGVDVVTTGNHAFDAAGTEQLFATTPQLLRPGNFAGSLPGASIALVERNGFAFLVGNVAGRDVHGTTHSPFRWADHQLVEAIDAARPQVALIDFHGDLASEKMAFAHRIDGRVTAVVGTHTHVTTDDARVLPGGTAYVTDVGMTGPSEGVIGFDVDAMVRAFAEPPQAPPAVVIDGACALSAVLITGDGRTPAIAITGHHRSWAHIDDVRMEVAAR